jgi:hypothetical protein
MQQFYAMFLEIPAWGRFGLISFLFGFIGLGISYALMPKPKSKSPLFSDPKPEISIFGIIGVLGFGLGFLCSAYWAYLDPKSMNASKRSFGQMIEVLGGEYGFALTSGLLGSVFVYFGLKSAYKLLVKKHEKITFKRNLKMTTLGIVKRNIRRVHPHLDVVLKLQNN